MRMLAVILANLAAILLVKLASPDPTHLLQLVHRDIFGRFEAASFSAARYFVSFDEDFSVYTKVYHMTQKSKTLDCFKNYKNFAKKHSASSFKSVHVHECNNSASRLNETFQFLRPFALTTLASTFHLPLDLSQQATAYKPTYGPLIYALK